MTKKLRQIIVKDIQINAPLLIRLLEFAKEDAKTDLVLHKIVERAQSLNRPLGTDDYKILVPEDTKN